MQEVFQTFLNRFRALRRVVWTIRHNHPNRLCCHRVQSLFEPKDRTTSYLVRSSPFLGPHSRNRTQARRKVAELEESIGVGFTSEPLVMAPPLVDIALCRLGQVRGEVWIGARHGAVAGLMVIELCQR